LQPGFVLLGVAGVWDAMERQAYLNAFTDAWVTYVADHVPRTSVLSDLELALFAGLGAKPGAMLIAGTGSIAAMRLDDGTIRRVGGWGPRVDDAGGGFWMGRAALLAVARAMDGRGEATLLSIPVAAHLRVDHADSTALANALRTASVDRIARLAPAVLAYAEEGDAVARSIRAEAARELASLVLALPASNTTVQLHGSLFLDPFFHAAVVHLLEGSGRGLSTRLLDDVLASAALRLHSGIEEA
jgi:N-acetylglucosamine kinase-like BadF-type ATPase